MTDERGSVGVAIPVYNRAEFLEATLRSVLEQTHPVADVVVVDDGSQDASATLAVTVGPPVRVVRQPHSGIGAARSRAIGLLQAEYVVPLDSDDLLTPRSIEARIDVLLGRPEIDVVFGQVRSFAECLAGQPVALDQCKPARVPDSMLIRRSAFERVGAFDHDLRVAETLDWMLRAREAGLREATVPEQVLWRRVHGANNSLIERPSIGEFPRVLKAALDRRRAGGE